MNVYHKNTIWKTKLSKTFSSIRKKQGEGISVKQLSKGQVFLLNIFALTV